VSSFLRVAAGLRRCGFVPFAWRLGISNQVVDNSVRPLLHW
jgi:hypothetical protein